MQSARNAVQSFRANEQAPKICSSHCSCRAAASLSSVAKLAANGVTTAQCPLLQFIHGVPYDGRDVCLRFYE